MTVTTKNVKCLLGKKLGMTQVWDADNKLVPVTVVEIAPNVVTQLRTVEKDGSGRLVNKEIRSLGPQIDHGLAK